MKRMLGILSLAAACLPVCAQYLPNSTFKNWKTACGYTYQTSKSTSKGGPHGNIQRPGEEPSDWNGSNVKQKVYVPIFGAQTGTSRDLVTKGDATDNGTIVKLTNTFVGVGKIGATAPAFINFGTPWVYAVSDVDNCDGGVYGGMELSSASATTHYQPDAIKGEFKRAASTTENAHIISYFWQGTYNSKVTATGTVSFDDVDRTVFNDVRTGSAAGTLIAKCDHTFTSTANGDWETIEVPINYLATPTTGKALKMNVIVSSADYWTRNNIQKNSLLEVKWVDLVYWHALSDLKWNGTTLSGFNENTTSYSVNEFYDASKVSYTVKGRMATATKSYNAATGKLTITVNNSVSGSTSYTIQFLTEKTYTGTLGVGNGSTYGKGATFSAKLLAESETKRSLKFENITLENAAGKQGIGTLYVPNVTVSGTSVTGTYNGTFSAGSDAAISSWQGSTWGTQQCNVSLTLSAGNSITGTITCPKLKMVFANKVFFYETNDVTRTAGTYNVTINRTFAQGWNTLCLPFSMTPAEIGAKAAQEFSSVSEGKTLNFATVSQMQANVPYLVFFENATTLPFYYCGAMQTPSAKGVTHDGITFSGNFTADKNMQGLYGVATGTDGHQRILLGSAGATLPAMAAFFSSTQSLANMSLRMEGENMTDIEAIQTTEHEAQTDVYTLQGTRIQPATKGARLPKGIYIINGKKVIVK